MRVEFFLFYQVSMVVSLIAMMTVIVLLWRRRNTNGAKAMTVLVTGLFTWTLGYTLESYHPELYQQNLFNNIAICGTLLVPSAWVVFAVNYTMGDRLITGWRILPFCIFPVITMVIVWNPDLRYLMWSEESFIEINGFYMTSREYGPFFWVVVVHNYVLLTAGAIILIKNMLFGVRVYAGQAISLIIAVVIPLIGNFLFVFNILPTMHMDMTPILFSISAVLFIFGVMRFNLFQVIPFAHRHMIQQMKEGILVFNSTNRLLEANPVAIEILQLTRADIGKEVNQLPAVSFVSSNATKTGIVNIELPLILSGTERIYEVESIQMQDSYNHHAGFLVVMRDITERKKVQEQMMAQDRLASIGELTSGVAHEINNPLAIIKGLIELTLERDLSDDLKEDMLIVNDEVDRATGIVKNLLTFARSQTDNKRPIDINVLIGKTVEMRLYEQAQSNIHTLIIPGENVPRIMGSELQLRQVLLNLIINAEYFISSMKRGGNITITTSEKDGNVIITVSDDGPGISPENVHRIFDPFFTTKDIGEGTGLGLSICHGIISEHEGTIEVRSNPGKETTFTVSIPAITK
ncbi:MAG: PAS domain S-box protein [Dehalococcoidales bacterium]|nr:PAS domain S-box protein [Dehalococcoidales bacterium]